MTMLNERAAQGSSSSFPVVLRPSRSRCARCASASGYTCSIFFACVALLDLHRGFSIFSLWTAALFSFLLAYMVIVAHADIKRY